MVKILTYIFFLAINTVLSIPNLYDNVNLYVEEPEPEVQRTIHGVKGKSSCPWRFFLSIDILHSKNLECRKILLINVWLEPFFIFFNLLGVSWISAVMSVKRFYIFRIQNKNQMLARLSCGSLFLTDITAEIYGR